MKCSWSCVYIVLNLILFKGVLNIAFKIYIYHLQDLPLTVDVFPVNSAIPQNINPHKCHSMAPAIPCYGCVSGTARDSNQFLSGCRRKATKD